MLKGSPRRPPARPVAVECKHHLTDDPEDTFEMFGSRSGPQCRYRVVDAVLMQPDNVHVAFDDQQAFEVGTAAPGLVQSIQLTAFVKEHGFRRVEVLRLALVQDAAPKRNDPTAAIAY